MNRRNKEKLASVSEKLTKDALDEYNKNVIVKGYSCNVINKDELSAAYETIKNELGSCDILINGAGGNQPGAITSIEMLKKEKEDSDYSFWNLDEDRIRDVMDLNYMGTLLPIQVFTKDMVEKRSARWRSLHASRHSCDDISGTTRLHRNLLRRQCTTAADCTSTMKAIHAPSTANRFR